MKPPKFEYFAPASLDEATSLLQQYGDEAKVLAGGQSLMPLLNMRLVRPAVIVDINRIPVLDYITPMTGGGLAIGALTRQRAVERSAAASETIPLLAAALPSIGHIQIRNRGTVGGSMAHGDPAAEIPAVSVTLEAGVVLASSKKQRSMSAEDFFLGYLTTALEPDELLTEVRFPALDGTWGWGFSEVSRREGDFAMVGAAALLQLGDDDTCLAARVTMFGVGSSPERMATVEELLVGGPIDGRKLDDVAKAISAEMDPPSDIHASAEYRRKTGGALARRAVAAAHSRATGVIT